jgi:dienelactone hydrolase
LRLGTGPTRETVAYFGGLKYEAVTGMATSINRLENRQSLVWRFLAASVVLALAACGGSGSGGDSPRGPSGSLTFTSCTVPAGRPSCLGTISWTTLNADAPSLSVDGVVLSDQASGTLDLDLPGDFVNVVLADGGVTLDSVTFRGVCETASAWDGALCTTYSIRLDERASTPFVENGVSVELEVVIFKPFGPGPFPTVMFNHGSTGDGSDPSLFTVTSVSEPVAKFFTDRGWMVAFPQRRGRGQSDGLYDEGFNANRTFYSCEREITLAGAERALDDLDAAVDWLRNRADVDTTRMLGAGASRGGVLSLVHMARRPDVFLGAVNFVGGWLGEGCGDHLDVNRTLFIAGAAFPDESIWLYANNDSFYSVAYSEANFNAFTNAGGLGTFNVYTRAAGLNGHFLTNDPLLWGPDLEAYIAALP